MITHPIARDIAVETLWNRAPSLSLNSTHGTASVQTTPKIVQPSVPRSASSVAPKALVAIVGMTRRLGLHGYVVGKTRPTTITRSLFGDGTHTGRPAAMESIGLDLHKRASATTAMRAP